MHTTCSHNLIWYIPRLNIGGAEIFTIDIINNLSKRNVNIYLVTDTYKSLLLKRLSSNIHIIHLNDTSGLLFPKKLLNLRNILKKRFDYLVISNLTHGNINTFLAGIGLNLNHISIEHNNLSKYLKHIPSIKNFILYLFCKVIYQKLNKIVAVSHSVKNDLIKNYNAYKVEVIHNPINIEIINKKSLVNIDFKIDNRYILFVGRLEKQKNLNELLFLFKEILLHEPDLDLVIAGSGSEQDSLILLASKLNISTSVHFCGYVDNPYPLIRNAELCILTSFFEGFGIFLAESLALGIKIFSYDKATLRDLVENEFLLSLFSSGLSLNDNVNKILTLIKADINKATIQKESNKFNINEITNKYIAYFNL